MAVVVAYDVGDGGVVLVSVLGSVLVTAVPCRVGIFVKIACSNRLLAELVVCESC